MHKKRTRRQQIAIRSFTYGAMTLFAVFGALVCLAWAMGFRFDFNDGKLTQVALLQFDSFPTGATVKVNGVTISGKTPTRANVKAGESDIEISKDGYRTWQKTVTLNSSEVLWLDYVRLIPNSISTDQIKSFSSLAQMRESPDGHWLLLRHSDSDRKVDNCPEGVACDRTYADYYKTAYKMTLADVSDPTNVRFSDISIDPNQITIPDANQSEKFSIVEWDEGSRYVLIKHQVGDKTEYLEIDRESKTTSKNLNKDFGMNISDPHFSGTSGQVFFAITDGDIRKFDYSNQTASAPLVTGVQSYRLSQNSQITFVATETKDNKTIQKVGIYDDGRVTTIKTYDEQQTTFAGITRYRDKDYLAIARGETVAIYPDPLSEDSKAKTAYLSSPGGVDWLSFSPSGRFIVAGHQSKIVDFDLDTDDNYSFEMEGLDGVAQWIDDTHMLSDYSDMISLVEFDGSNSERIVSGSGRAALSRDEKYLFSFDVSDGSAALQRSKLYID